MKVPIYVIIVENVSFQHSSERNVNSTFGM